MARLLNVGIMQSEIYTGFEESLSRIERDVKVLMSGIIKPEIILGVELGIGVKVSDIIPGKITEALGKIAEKYGIYFIPGSMIEQSKKDGGDVKYNALPIFGPDGELIDVYRKICPYYPYEENVIPGDQYVVFDIPEKNIKMGVMICHDWCFPEISRNLTLMGAEVLFRPAIDPEGLYETFKHVPCTRALENQAYFISLNAASGFFNPYGHSVIAGPQGQVLYEAGTNSTIYCMTLDMDMVKSTREHGTFFTEQLVRQLKLFDIPMPFSNDIGKAPVFRNLADADKTIKERAEKMRNINMGTIGKK